mmetsp:Transcript_14442/g.47209  ORF Transcript_14442/g.47209 Transcript_14442/m.47209 type:complete len:250 (-) Transcript_14442:1743-2492(-)
MRSICIASVFGTCLGEEGSRVAWPFFPFSSSTETTTSGNTATYLSIETQLQNAHFLGRKMPPSCACRKSGDSDAECVQFDCSCLCDLTAGMCDFNCCCDDECSQEQKNRFDVLNACIHEGQFDRELIKCYSTKEVDRVNPKFPLAAKSLARGSVDRMLCVRYDNSDFQGEFYHDPGLPGSSSFESTFGQNEYDYAQWKQNALASYATDKTYDFGDSVGVAVSLGAAGEDDYATAFGGVLPFPTTSHLGT